MRNILHLAVVGAVLGAATVAHAGGYNDSGCGVGSMIWDQNKKASQILAATTNQYFGQSYSITSGTSGCSESGMARRRREREKFIATNFRSLSRELASGQGEYAASFAAIMGCRAEAIPAFLQFTKERYGEMFPQSGTTPQQLLDDVSSRIETSPAISQACRL